MLRERLGPTSDYASSLISIQAAYINTNHPEFVAGSAAIARGELPPGTKPIPSINANIADADADDDVSDSDASEQGGNVNGIATKNKSRSVSHSQPGDRRQPIPVAPTPRHLNEPKTDKYRAGSLSGVASAPPPTGLMSMSNVSTSPHSTRETFLNYFFGGAGGPGGPSGGPGMTGTSGSGLQQRNDGRTARDLLPDLGTRKATGAGLHVGRGYGLEPPPAYDMKSLGKHLEAVSALYV